MVFGIMDQYEPFNEKYKAQGIEILQIATEDDVNLYRPKAALTTSHQILFMDNMFRIALDLRPKNPYYVCQFERTIPDGELMV